MSFQVQRSNRREVNVSRLANVTKNNEVVIVPGKILGAGTIGHKLTVCAFSISARSYKEDHRLGREDYYT